jgi:hypothetical protein
MDGKTSVSLNSVCRLASSFLERKQGVKLLGSDRVALWQVVPPHTFVIWLAAGSGDGSRAPRWAFPNDGTQVPAAFVSPLQYTSELLPTVRSLDQSKQTIKLRPGPGQEDAATLGR